MAEHYNAVSLQLFNPHVFWFCCCGRGVRPISPFCVGQVKFQATGNKKAEIAIRPIGIPRDLHRPLPYLAILMELGNEPKYQENRSKIKATASEPVDGGEFEELTGKLITTVTDIISKTTKER